MIATRRVYSNPENDEGTRILVDRVWPRGLTREKVHADLWLKELAPSTDLRRWFGHDPQKWDEFKQRYFMELRQKADDVDRLSEIAHKGKVTLLYGAREERFNNAVALKEYLESGEKPR